MEARQNTIQLLKKQCALMRIGLGIVLVANLINSLVFESGNVIGVQHIRSGGVIFRLRVGENVTCAPTDRHHVKLPLIHKFDKGFEGDQPEIECNSQLPEILLICRQVRFRLLVA